MRSIILTSETDFDGWRRAARSFVVNNVKPSDVTWRVRSNAPELFEPSAPPLEASHNTFSVSAKFVALAQAAILHRDPLRFAILYRLLWRLRGDRDQYRMRAAVRFREIGREQKSHYVAWFEPEHHIVEATAPFFASRFADMPWSILTPDVCAHWDGHAVAITPGIEAPGEDRLEQTWRRTYAGIFNPARLKTALPR